MDKRAKRIGIFVALCSIMVVLALSLISTKEKDYVALDGEYSEYYCGLEDNQLYIEPVKIKTELRNKDAYLYFNVHRRNLVSLDNYGEFTYITYTNNADTRLTEILLAPQLPPEVIVKSDKSLFTTVFGNSDEINIVAEGNTIKGQQRLPYGYLYTAVTSEKLPDSIEFKNSVESDIIANIKYSAKSETKDVVININGIGQVSLSGISVIKDGPGVYYGKDKILRLYNYKTDVAYVWVTNINNSLMLNTIANLQNTDYNNVYADKDYKDKDKMGYRTYSIMTKAGIYTIRLNEDAPAELFDEMMIAMNIKKEDAKIELPFKL